MASDAELNERLEFLRRAEKLKETLRSAYTSGGRQESVADHSWRLSLLVITVSDLLPEIDLLHLLKLCIIHDLGEVVDGDIPAPEQVHSKSKSSKEREDFKSLLTNLPASLQHEFLCLWDEYENASSVEAKLAKALDKIETLLQHTQGDNPADFDYDFNLEYGKSYTDAIPLAARLRAIIDEDTRRLAEGDTGRAKQL